MKSRKDRKIYTTTDIQFTEASLKDLKFIFIINSIPIILNVFCVGSKTYWTAQRRVSAAIACNSFNSVLPQISPISSQEGAKVLFKIEYSHLNY